MPHKSALPPKRLEAASGLRHARPSARSAPGAHRGGGHARQRRLEVIHARRALDAWRDRGKRGKGTADNMSREHVQRVQILKYINEQVRMYTYICIYIQIYVLFCLFTYVYK